MSLIDVSGLTFAYEGSPDNIFENVSFQIDTDWKLGFIGRNGRGKTTFLKLLTGKFEYQGSISASVSFEYFPFDIENGSQIALDAVAGICPDAEEWRIERELSLLDVSEDVLYRPYDTLTGGERTKLMLAALFVKEGGFPLIDEPTNNLDMNGRNIVSSYLRAKKGFILVSHDRAFLDNAVDHVLSINRANIAVQKGNFSSWQKNKELEDRFKAEKNEKLQKDIKRLSEAARQTARWSDEVEKTKIGHHVADRGAVGHKAAKMMKRSKVTEARRIKAAEEKSGLLKNIDEAETLSIRPLRYPKVTLAEVSNLSISYGGGAVCENVRFAIKRGDRVALSGRNGSGKSSILNLLLGENVPFSGDVGIGGGLVFSHVSQDTSGLRGNLRDFALEHGIDESLFKAILRKLDFSRLQLEKDMADFSGGQKKKALIAKSLCESAHLYVWDEPLNFIDVLSRVQIEELILAGRPTMIFVEHDRSFVEAVATDIIRL